MDAPQAKPRGSVLAIDHGEKHTGLACCDGLRLAVTPLEPFHGPGRGAAILARIERELAQRDVAVLLLGLPLRGDGQGGRKAGARAEAVQAFARELAARFQGQELVLHDEHLTSKAGEELAREAGLSKKRARLWSDSLAAVALLRDWIQAGEPRKAGPHAS